MEDDRLYLNLFFPLACAGRNPSPLSREIRTFIYFSAPARAAEQTSAGNECFLKEFRGLKIKSALPSALNNLVRP